MNSYIRLEEGGTADDIASGAAERLAPVCGDSHGVAIKIVVWRALIGWEFDVAGDVWAIAESEGASDLE